MTVEKQDGRGLDGSGLNSQAGNVRLNDDMAVFATPPNRALCKAAHQADVDGIDLGENFKASEHGLFSSMFRIFGLGVQGVQGEMSHCGSELRPTAARLPAQGEITDRL